MAGHWRGGCSFYTIPPYRIVWSAATQVVLDLQPLADSAAFIREESADRQTAGQLDSERDENRLSEWVGGQMSRQVVLFRTKRSYKAHRD